MSRILCIFLGLLVLAGCGAAQSAATETPAINITTTAPATAPTLIPTSVPTATSLPPTVKPTDVPIARPTEGTTARPTDVPTAAPIPTDQPTPTDLPIPTAETTTEPTPEVLRYVFPVKADRYDISSSHHDYPAADIACPIGSGFVAVTSGVVDYVSYEDVWPKTQKPEDRGGLSVAIIGDDGVRYYGSHLSQIAEGIKPGVRVEAGQMLGLTGESGNAKGVYPHLHFGISHPTEPDDWQIRRGEIWPQKYLKAWARGESLTPKL